jgi:hypothetical protein
MKETLEAARIQAEFKDEKKDGSFYSLPFHRNQMILNASAQPQFVKPAKNPTAFYESVLTEK